MYHVTQSRSCSSTVSFLIRPNPEYPVLLFTCCFFQHPSTLELASEFSLTLLLPLHHQLSYQTMPGLFALHILHHFCYLSNHGATLYTHKSFDSCQLLHLSCQPTTPLNSLYIHVIKRHLPLPLHLCLVPGYIGSWAMLHLPGPCGLECPGRMVPTQNKDSLHMWSWPGSL